MRLFQDLTQFAPRSLPVLLNFNQAALRYTEDKQAQFAGPFFIGRDGSTYVTIDELDKDIVAMLGKLKVGEISIPDSLY